MCKDVCYLVLIFLCHSYVGFTLKIVRFQYSRFIIDREKKKKIPLSNQSCRKMSLSQIRIFSFIPHTHRISCSKKYYRSEGIQARFDLGVW